MWDANIISSCFFFFSRFILFISKAVTESEGQTDTPIPIQQEREKGERSSNHRFTPQMTIRSFFLVSQLGIGAQACGPNSTVFLGMLAMNWISSGTTGTRTDTYMGCFHYKCQLYPPYHNLALVHVILCFFFFLRVNLLFHMPNTSYLDTFVLITERIKLGVLL